MGTSTLPDRRNALVVEDQPGVLSAASAFVEAAGFDVVRVSSHERTLTDLLCSPKFVLLVTNYSVAGTNGVELAAHALTKNADLKILIIADFPHAGALDGLPQGTAILVKPFRRAAMIATLESLFDPANDPRQRHNDSLQRDKDSLQRDKDSLQRDRDNLQRDNDSLQRDNDEQQRDVNNVGHENEYRQRLDAARQREGAGRQREDAGRHREDAGRQREDTGRQREDTGRQREDIGRQREDAVRHHQMMERVRHTDEIRRWTDVFHNVAVGVGVVDAQGDTLLYANEALARMHATSADEIKYTPVRDLCVPSERENVDTSYAIADELGEVNFEAEHLRKDGRVFPAEIHITTVRDDSNFLQYRIATIHDISARRQIEFERDRGRRLESVGQLTAGIAHDFNNLIQGLMAYLEFVEDDPQVSAATREHVDNAMNMAMQGGELAHKLLLFARGQVLEPRALSLGTFFAELRGIITHTIKPHTHLYMEVETGLSQVWVDAVHLQSALLNLAINATDAMPSGGDLRITAVADNGVEKIDSKRFVLICVRDSGTGISSENLLKVCDPFFSTKGSNGTGLGLSMVHSFAQQSGGNLRITSEPGKGTSVELRLPFARATTSDAAPFVQMTVAEP